LLAVVALRRAASPRGYLLFIALMEVETSVAWVTFQGSEIPESRMQALPL